MEPASRELLRTPTGHRHPRVALLGDTGPVDERADFNVTVETDDGQITAYVTGELDMSTCERLRDAIEPHLGPDQRIVLDLSGVHFMDSSCIAMLVAAHNELTQGGGSLIMRNPSDAARRVLTITETMALFEEDAAQ